MPVAAAQIAPVFLDRAATLVKVLGWTQRAAQEGARLVVFAEAILPGYPVWLACTNGAAFDAAGHYHRSDVFRIEVDRTRAEPVSFSE